MKIVYISLLFGFVGIFKGRAQEENSGRNPINLEEVVVSASQIEPQSVKKSVKNVQVITKEQIKSFGATTLADVLNQSINITVVPDTQLGGSSVSLFGLSSKYFKILIDNVPLVGESGVGNNTDLSQINLDDIEQIEIIEGAMGVTHGANAVSGILNIITKKNHQNKWDIAYTLQEESVGKEYNLSDKGRHIQSFRASYKINPHWSASVGSVRNKFNGFYDAYKGKNALYGKRGLTFLPREYMQFNGLINYKSPNLNLFYKFERMKQEIDYYSRDVKSGYNDALGAYRYGDDKRHFYTRNYHNFNSFGKFYGLSYNVSASYQTQTREEEIFRYIIPLRKEINNKKSKQEEMSVFFSTGTLSKKLGDTKIQLGYEVVNNQGFAIVNGAKNTFKEVEKSINNYDAFALVEHQYSNAFSVQTGGRFSYQELFKNQYAFSLGTRYLLPNELEWRASVGQSYRTPDFSELYSTIMFEGHYFFANENLIPERSLSFETSLKKSTQFSDKNRLDNRLILSHNRIKDRIYQALVGFQDATPIYQQININTYNYFNLSNSNQWDFHNLSLRGGVSALWVSQSISDGQYKNDDRYLLNFSADVGLTYKIRNWDASFSAYYKYKGISQNWASGLQGYYIFQREPYHLLDISAEKKFLNRKLELGFGVRNLTNTTTIFGSAVTDGHTTTNSTLLFYGRSYFLKLTYNLNINY